MLLKTKVFGNPTVLVEVEPDVFEEKPTYCFGQSCWNTGKCKNCYIDYLPFYQEKVGFIIPEKFVEMAVAYLGATYKTVRYTNEDWKLLKNKLRKVEDFK